MESIAHTLNVILHRLHDLRLILVEVKRGVEFRLAGDRLDGTGAIPIG